MKTGTQSDSFIMEALRRRETQRTVCKCGNRLYVSKTSPERTLCVLVQVTLMTWVCT